MAAALPGARVVDEPRLSVVASPFLPVRGPSAGAGCDLQESSIVKPLLIIASQHSLYERRDVHKVSDATLFINSVATFIKLVMRRY